MKDQPAAYEQKRRRRPAREAEAHRRRDTVAEMQQIERDPDELADRLKEMENDPNEA